MIVKPPSNSVSQVGPRAHHFVALISIIVGMSFLLENYSGNQATVVPFRVTNNLFDIEFGQEVWGFSLVVCGVLLLIPYSMWFRVFVLCLSTLLWVVYALFTLWSTMFSPFSSQAGSFVGILSSGMVACCLLAATNLRRDFPKRVDK
jgi:hypothetical protein